MKTYKFKINGNEYNVVINSTEGNLAYVNVNGTDYVVEMENTPAPQVQPTTSPSNAAPANQQPTTKQAPATSGHGKTIQSPLPGVIISIKVNVGDTVKAGQTVAVLEAMKMENDILAESDGTVISVNVAKGDSVLEGAAIVTIG